jgi:hypothetical protein
MYFPTTIVNNSDIIKIELYAYQASGPYDNNHKLTVYFNNARLTHIHTTLSSQIILPNITEITDPSGYEVVVTDSSGFLYKSSTKTFVIEHPLRDDKYLVHACLEGPEAGVYYRGEGIIQEGFKSTIIHLPEYTKRFYDYTIQVTCIGLPRLLGVSRVYKGMFEVYSDSFKETEFYWTVFGKRNDIVTEPYKDAVNVSGDGPYLYIN